MSLCFYSSGRSDNRVDSTQHLCSRCKTPLETGDLRCSICGQAAPQVATVQQKTIVKILRCSGCGAAVAYDPQRQAPSCSFCDSVVKIETIEDPMEQTEGYLPFTVTREEARAALKNWLGSLGWFRPSDLRSSARLQELRPLWWVAWVFDADSRISWTADSNADARSLLLGAACRTNEFQFPQHSGLGVTWVIVSGSRVDEPRRRSQQRPGRATRRG